MKIGITCYPTYGGSGVVATELGIELADRDHEIHFITYSDRKSTRLNSSHLVISYAVFFLKIKMLESSSGIPAAEMVLEIPSWGRVMPGGPKRDGTLTRICAHSSVPSSAAATAIATRLGPP